MDDGHQLPRGHAVERIPEPRRIAALVDLQAPRQGRRPPVQLLVEVVAQPADRLRQNDPRGDRIAERGQRYPPSPARDPGADPAERHRAPNAQSAIPDPECRAQPGAAGSEICRPVRHDVIDPPTDQPERHGPQRDVIDHATLAAARLPPAITDDQRRDDPGDDAQRVRAQRNRPDEPDALCRAGDVGQRGDRHARTAWRTPSASSAVSARTAGRPSSSADTSADPTITPSA